MPPVRPFAVNQFTTKPNSFEQDIELLVNLKIPHLELCQFKLSHDNSVAARKLQQLKDAGLSVTSVQSTVHSLFPDSMAAEPAEPEARLEQFRACIDLVTSQLPRTVEQNIPFVLITGVVPQGNLRRGWRELTRLLPDLVRYAADRGVRIAFETLHPVLMNHDTFVCKLEDALSLYEQIDHPAFGLVIDTWHIWPEPDLKQRLAQHRGSIAAVHLSDWPAGGPRLFNDRLIPGDGTIDFARIFDALDAANYNGPVTLELLSDLSLPDSLWRMDFAKLIKKSLQALDGIKVQSA